MANDKPFAPLSARLIKRLAGLALLCILAGSIIHALLLYQQEKRHFTQTIQQLAELHVPLLQVALWDIEVEALSHQVEQIALLPDIAAVELRATTGLDVRAGNFASLIRPDASLRIPPPDGGAFDLAELHVYYQHRRLTRAIIAAAGLRLFELSLFTLLICLVIFHYLRRELVVPLGRMADYVGTLVPEKHPPALAPLHPQRPWRDEIDQVAEGFDTLRESIGHYAARHEQALHALEQERDSLDRRVAERTEELAFVSGYQEWLSQSMLSFMHTGHADYPDTLQRLLGELAGYLKLDACALFERHGQQSWTTRLVWFGSEDWPWLEHTHRQLGLPGQPQEAGWTLQSSEADPGVMLVRYHSQQRGFTCAVRSAERQALPPARLNLLEDAGQWLFSLLQRWEHALDLERARQELLMLSRRDHLTGLANRRHFDERRADEVRRALRNQQPVGLLMIDVDYFKNFNDLYGHGHGDDCLVALADQLKRRFKRAAELPARLGGEEFSVLLPGYSREQALAAAENLREAVFGLGIAHNGSPLRVVTISVGCVWWDGSSSDEGVTRLISRLMNAADSALYQAKGQGRNQVCAQALEAPGAEDEPGTGVEQRDC